MVKLKIEMSMAELIGKVARKRDLGILSAADFNGNNRDSYQPSEYSLQLPTYARGRPVGGIDATISSQPPNPIELNNVTKPKVPALRGVNVAAVSSGPSSRRPSIGAANATDADGQPKMAIYRTREVVVEIERVPPNQGHQPSTSQASQLTLDDSFDITNFEDDSSIKGLSAAQKSLALPNIQAPWATQEFSTKIWDGTNCDEDPTLPTTIAKIGSWPKDT